MSENTKKNKKATAPKHEVPAEKHAKSTSAHASESKSKAQHAEHRPAAASAPTAQRMAPQRMMIVGVLMVAAFFGAYNFASAKNSAQAAGYGAGQYAAGGAAGGAGGAAGGGGCCGGGGAPVEGTTTVEGDVQKIAVDTSAGSFNPNVIKVKAGVPTEITFSQSPGGCLSGVFFPDFNINEDLTAGPKTVKLPALEKGQTFTFYCQMQMVSAQIVVE